MNKKLAISAALLSSLFLLAGCGNQNANVANSNQNSQTKSNSQTNQSGQRRGAPDYGQPNRQADVRGVIKSITGNEASILLIAAPVGGRKSSSTDATSTNPGAPSVSLTGAAARGNGGGFMGGPGGGRQGGQGGQGGATDRTAMLDQLKKMSTGEEKIVIPVGIKMLKSSINTKTNKREMVEASLSDITADKFITIWLNTSVTDKKVADFVLIN